MIPTEPAGKGSHILGRLIFQLQRLEREPRRFGEAGVLTPSEIHMIDAIGCDSGMLMSELAGRLGVTKGAVTQLVAKLESKELVQRGSHPNDSRAVVISLTATGKSAYRAHEAVHHEFYQELSRQFTPEEIAVFERCIEKLTQMLK
ncbi:MarR family winged helix-turn-helix transcriptional regulator [Paenibacillus sp. J2TS4]|uniref:MarR family winged helix-turn-helix transcriptional regulator n=1 Tax=Paenibacillus sp. J2TS4 TaxID=2807194 RepID=UPI001B14A307|nr:MarR family transcriptional regulator [Paenibacillus sp. J2TS4]GIP32132.1 hypothetical protein J2TS4_13420 [Paenibacillus sp. J2TS4]